MRLSGLLRLAALLQAAALGMRTGLPQAGPTARRVVLRRALGAAGGAAAAALGSAAPAEASLEGTDWPLWPALPIAPYGQRKTVMREAVPGKVWTFDQMLGIFYVHVPIRMTVVAMEQGGLFVYAPVAPTAELRAMLQPLVGTHGPVKLAAAPAALASPSPAPSPAPSPSPSPSPAPSPAPHPHPHPHPRPHLTLTSP